jgi:hypothetical protein
MLAVTTRTSSEAASLATSRTLLERTERDVRISVDVGHLDPPL